MHTLWNTMANSNKCTVAQQTDKLKGIGKVSTTVLTCKVNKQSADIKDHRDYPIPDGIKICIANKIKICIANNKKFYQKLYRRKATRGKDQLNGKPKTFKDKNG